MNSKLRDAVDRILAPYGARRLSDDERLARGDDDFLFGWEIDTQIKYNGEPLFVHLIYDGEIDKALPKIFISKPHIKPLSFPHLEAGGKLCVWPDRYIVDLKDIDYVVELLIDTVNLLQQAISGEMDSHFEEEFQNYWIYHCKNYFDNFSILDQNNHSTRQISIKKIGKENFIYGENEDQIAKWLDNRGLLPKYGKQRTKAALGISKSVIICFDAAISPKEYPRTAGELYQLIQVRFGAESNKVLELIAKSLVSKHLSYPSVVLSFWSRSGRSIVGLFFARGVFSRHNRRSVSDGFRKSIPLRHLVQRTSQIPTYGIGIVRADPSWVVGRDSNSSREAISKHSVVIIGCGSLGSSIAKILVKSGVSNLILVDGDSVMTENISRHELGFRCVGKNKAKALKEDLSENYPHTNVQAYETYFSQRKCFSKLIGHADLIVSCTGNWYSDQAVIEFQAQDEVPAVFAFVEAHACVGHVLLNLPNSGAYQSLYIDSGSDIGKLKQPVTLWPSETLVRTPACAGEFQPYGAIEIAHLHALAAKKVVDCMLDVNIVNSSHTIWMGSDNDLRKLGGNWNRDWEEQYVSIKNGCRKIELIFRDNEWVIEDGY